MRERYKSIGITRLCAWFGITRQAYYVNARSERQRATEADLVCQRLQEIRGDHARMGGRKLYEKLQPFFQEHGIKMGRDALFALLSDRKMLIKRRRSAVITTNSNHWFRRYPNLIKDIVPTVPNQIWVSDITYWRISPNLVLYISFITDAYSRKIVGFHVAQTLAAVESLRALEMAIASIDSATATHLTHHSDRGAQYCCNQYTTLLKEKNIAISMTQNGDPLENAIAERLNGIIKQEYLDTKEIKIFADAQRMVSRAVFLYNTDRPHLSLGNQTPESIHNGQSTIPPKRIWKNYYSKKNTADNLIQDYQQPVNTLQDNQ